MSITSPHPSAQFGATLRVHLDDHPGAFAADRTFLLTLFGGRAACEDRSA